MPRTVHTEFSGGILRVEITGERQPPGPIGTNEAIESWRSISRARERFNATLVLVIDKLMGPASSIRSHAVGASIGQVADNSAVKCALVVADPDVRRNVVLGARMATARGRQTEVFETVEEAEAWLRSV